jgi:hypothetical protein
MTSLLLVLACVGVAGQAPAATPQSAPNLIRIYLQTADGGHPDELAARRQSLDHLAASLAGQKKGSVIAVVDAESKADIVVDILQRSLTTPKVVFGLGPSRAGGASSPSMNPPVRHATLHVTLEMASGSDRVEFKNNNRATETERGWKSAADDIAKQIEKWIADRRTLILKARRPQTR